MTINRRDVIAGLAGLGLSVSARSEANREMMYRPFGKSGEKVSAIGLGGHHIGRPKDPQVGIRLIRTALDNGLNFLDNCWDYNGGESEVRMGQALRDGYRQKVFLMTKFDGGPKPQHSSRSTNL